MKNFAIIKDNTIINVCVWDGVTEWHPPEFCHAVELPEGAWIGWFFDGEKWINPFPSEEIQNP